MKTLTNNMEETLNVIQEKKNLRLPMTFKERVLLMIKTIDESLERTLAIAKLDWDKEVRSYIIKKEYVAVIGKELTRKYHSFNYEIYN